MRGGKTGSHLGDVVVQLGDVDYVVNGIGSADFMEEVHTDLVQIRTTT
jgi:hypothetical protein